MKPLLVIFGITGQQGGSVANYVLNNSDLNSRFQIRGISRDATTSKALFFQDRGVELRQADWNDTESLAAALQNAHTVFMVTLPAGLDERGNPRETTHGKICVDAAVAAGVEYLVFGTLPNVIEISGRRYLGAHHFNAKNEIEAHIRQKPIHSAFFAPSAFMQNYLGLMAPKCAGSGEVYHIRDQLAPQDLLPLFDIEADTGKLVGTILRDFSEFEGKTLAAAERLYSMEEIAMIMSKATSMDIRYQQVSEKEMSEILPPQMAHGFVQARLYQMEFGGFYGPDTARLIALTNEKVPEPLTSFQDFLAKSNDAHSLG